MARPQPITVLVLLPWSRSTVTRFDLSELMNGGQLAPNVDGQLWQPAQENTVLSPKTDPLGH
jgi:hypothetical protein